MRRARIELFAASFLMLFVELVLIRWTGAYVVHLSYFANFVLLGSFLGIGVGFLRGRRGPDLFGWAPVVLALFVGLVIAFPATIDRTGDDLVYFGIEQNGLPAWILLPFVFLATAGVLACVAHGVATRFDRFAPLEAYRLDILGSLAGVAVFAVMAFAGAGPVAWGVVGASVFVFLLRRPTMVQAAALVAILALFAIGTVRGDTVWSPYYRILVEELDDGRIVAISANGVAHQAAYDTRGTDYDRIYEHLAEIPERVLIVGAGNGNDVATALRHGVGSIDAVEIDPALMDIGVERHPAQPYDDPRVTRIVDDGRAYLERTSQTYDMILFALPDSLTLVSGQASVRLESYLFTREAVDAAAERLSEHGVFVMYNFYREGWLADRLAGTLAEVFRSPPCVDLGVDVGGEVGRWSLFIGSRSPSAVVCEQRWSPPGDVVAPATDDRPFVYLRERSIPLRYLAALGLIVLASIAIVRTFGSRFRPMRGYTDLFFMGAAFLLLETKNVVQFALLFGTTWFVNALVFFGILASVYLAVELERKLRIGRRTLLFGLLFAGLLIAGAVPASWLLGLPAVPKFVIAAALAFLPIFCANLVFAERFRDATNPTAAFGANLLGAMVGGALEYLSLATGYRGLLIVAAVLYAAAWASMPRATAAPRASAAADPLAIAARSRTG